MMNDIEKIRSEGGDGPVSTVCFTGHRNIPAATAARMPALLGRVISSLCARGATTFRAGGAMGFDTVAALKVLDMKAEFPHLRLELILPCRDQTRGWDDMSIKTYHYIISHADAHRYLYETYVDGCMLARDRELVRGADVCVAYCARSHGGTAYTYTHAMREGLELINLNDLL